MYSLMKMETMSSAFASKIGKKYKDILIVAFE